MVTTRPTLYGHHGMAASTHWLATGTAQAILDRGGNAFDAAVAGCLVLHIVEPHLNGPGGDLVGLVSAGGAAPVVLNGQGPAPRRATIAHMRAENLDSVPGAGGLAAAVPGAMLALLRLLRDHGTMEFADVAQPAIEYARHGVIVSDRWADAVDAVQSLFRDHWTSSAAVWMPNGRPPRPGETATNPAWADTLERLVAESSRGADRTERIDLVSAAWREGFVARALAAFLAKPHMHSDGREHAGVLDMDDMRVAEASWEQPVRVRFRGTDVVKPASWGSGPVMLQVFSILESFRDDRLDPSTPDGVHTIVEAFKLALADRDAYYGERTDEVLRALLDPDRAAARAQTIGNRASTEWRPGAVAGASPWMPPLATVGGSAAGVGEPTVDTSGRTRGDTCHIDVVDRFGNIASITPSGGWLQSSPAVPELGFAAGTRLQMSWLDEGSPSALRPGDRPRTTLSPTMLVRDGAVVEALGTPGGDQQDQWQVPYILRRLLFGYSPQEAIDAPTFHTTHMVGSFWPRTWTPAGLVVEDRLGEDVIAQLAALGHRITVSGSWSLGRLLMVGRDAASGMLMAAANPRGALGYASGR